MYHADYKNIIIIMTIMFTVGSCLVLRAVLPFLAFC